MEPSKEQERAAPWAAGGPDRTEGNRLHGEARGSCLRGGAIRTREREGRPARRMAFLGCLLLYLLHPAEASEPRRAAAMEVLSGGDRGDGGWSSGSLALKRPKPGSIWQGPKELWCRLPPERGAGALRPAEVADPGAPPEEAFPPPAYLSPLLLFFVTLPTLEEVATYFAEALGETPVIDGPQRLRFERLLAFVWGKSWRRCVLSGGPRGAPGVTLDWWTNDDFGLSELREFFEAPFFRQSESVRFYQWLGEGGAHEADFRGHRLRMVMGRRDGVLFVRIQWWRSAPEADASQGLLDFDSFEQTSANVNTTAVDAVCVRRNSNGCRMFRARLPVLGCGNSAGFLNKRRSGGAISDGVAGFLRRLPHHLIAEPFGGIPQLKLLGDGHPVVAHNLSPPLFTNQHALVLRLKCDPDRICQGRGPAQNPLTGLNPKQHLFA